MDKRKKHIIAILLILVPFYMLAFVQKLLFDQSDYMVHEFLGLFMLLGILGIAVVLLLNSVYLKNSWRAFAKTAGSPIQDLSIGFLLVTIYYFLEVISWNSYGAWIHFEQDRSHIDQLLTEIFANPVYALLMIGPFSWINEIFSILSITFIINKMDVIIRSQQQKWIIILFPACLFSLLQIDMGPKEMIDSFLIIGVFSYTYMKYQRIYPLFLAAILVQTLDLIMYWMRH